jgi:hypothetical protein
MSSLASSSAKVLSTPSIIRAMIEAGNIPETSVNFYQPTQCNIPEDSHLYTHHHENLKYLQKYAHPLITGELTETSGECKHIYMKNVLRLCEWILLSDGRFKLYFWSPA